MFNLFRKKKELENKDDQKNFFYEDKNSLIIYLKCSKCGEKFRSYLRKGYDFITDYDNGGYIIDKEYIGSKCFNKIHLSATFDQNYRLIDYRLENGEIITKEEWESVNNE